MHTTHQHSASISSPVGQSISVSSFPSRPTHKSRRPSIANTMSSFKDTLRGRIDGKLQEVYDRGHRRIHSNSSQHSEKRSTSPVPQGLVISEPSLNSSDSSLPSQRLAPLGSGAIIVSTPAEALALTGQRRAMNAAASRSSPDRINQIQQKHPEPVKEEEDGSYDIPTSPVLRPLPSSTPTSPVMKARNRRDWEQSRRSAENNISSPPHSSRSLPLPPVKQSPRNSEDSSQQSRRRSPLIDTRQTLPEDTDQIAERASVDEVPGPHLKVPAAKSTTARQSNASTSSETASNSALDEGECFAAAPRLPYDLASALPQPMFEPILLTNLPANLHKIDPNKLVVVLETENAKFKSTYSTLTARPSYLASFLAELIQSTIYDPEPQVQTPYNEQLELDTASTYSQRSELEDSEEDLGGFNSLFQNHLASTGVIKTGKIRRKADLTSIIHIFLDRKSEPYSHIMTYLRAPALPNYPKGMLPYAARLFPAAKHSFATKRLESLLDLRDEASYLGLLDLVILCDTELAGQVPIVAPHTERNRISAHSTHTLIDSTGDGQSSEKDGTKGLENTSPQIGSIDIPVVLPAQLPLKVPAKVPKPHGIDLDGGSITRLDRRAGHIGGERVLNASQLRAQTQNQRAKSPPLEGNYF